MIKEYKRRLSCASCVNILFKGKEVSEGRRPTYYVTTCTSIKRSTNSQIYLLALLPQPVKSNASELVI